MGVLTQKGETVTIICRHCGKPYSYPYAGGELRAFHRPDPKTAKGKDCKTLYDNQVLRAQRVKATQAALDEAGRVSQEALDAAWRQGRAAGLEEGKSSIHEEVKQEVRVRIRNLFGKDDTSRTQAVRLSTQGWLLDMMQGERRQLLRRLAEAQDAARALPRGRQAQRQARAAVTRYEREMDTRLLPLLADLTELFER